MHNSFIKKMDKIMVERHLVSVKKRGIMQYDVPPNIRAMLVN
jgi:hypothetical protein